MLTLGQMDRIVRKTLLTFQGFEVERREEGTAILYDVYENHTSDKKFLGTYRIWEWHDGSHRCSWMPLDINDPYVVRMRNLVWEAVTANTAPANLASEQDTI
jgi:hypothetical protein